VAQRVWPVFSVGSRLPGGGPRQPPFRPGSGARYGFALALAFAFGGGGGGFGIGIGVSGSHTA
jgi:hypothetical protein